MYRIVTGNGGMNLPNRLTIARLVMIPVFVALFYVKFPGHYFVALGVFLLATLTDMLDGRLARKYSLITNLGKFLDPIADKVLVLCAYVLFITVYDVTFNAYFEGAYWPLVCAGCGVTVILAREILVSGFRLVASGKNVTIAADMFGKYKTVSEYIAVTIIMVAAGLYEFESLQDSLGVKITNYVGLIFFAISVVLAVISGTNYIVKNISVLRDDPDKEGTGKTEETLELSEIERVECLVEDGEEPMKEFSKDLAEASDDSEERT